MSAKYESVAAEEERGSPAVVRLDSHDRGEEIASDSIILDSSQPSEGSSTGQGWGDWFKSWGMLVGRKAVDGGEKIGEVVATFLGLNESKYDYVLRYYLQQQEEKKRMREEEDRDAVELEEAISDQSRAVEDDRAGAEPL